MFSKQGNFIDARPHLEECCRLDNAVTVNPFAKAYALHKLGVLNWKIGVYQYSIRFLLSCSAVFNTHRNVKEFQSSSASLVEIRGLVIVLITLGQVHISLGEV